MSWDFQPSIHPDANQLNVFVEGLATARERDRMLAHLAECAQCRKAVFLMQPRVEPDRPTTIPAKPWTWRWLVPVGLPAAALACVLIAVLIYIRPRVGTSQIVQQNARLSQPQIQPPPTQVPTTQPPPRAVAPIVSSEGVARSGNPAHAIASNAAPPNLSRQEKQHFASELNLPGSKSHQMAANIGPPAAMATAPPSVIQGRPIGGASTDVDRGAGIGSGAGAGILKTQTPPNTAQNGLASKKDLSTLGGPIEADATLSGVSGHITDRTGAVVAGATVTVRDASGKTRQTTTGTDGSFHLTELPPGQYEVTAAAAGFKTSQQSIELKPSELATLEPMLDVGTASQTVEVTGASPTLQTESANVSSAVTEKEVTQSGLNGRNFTQLISLAPGTTTVSHGKRSVALDSAGNLFVSQARGKKWKKVNAQWAGKAVRIELTSAFNGGVAPAQNDTAPASTDAMFQLTTDTGAVWTSKDGIHWRQQ